MKNKPTFTNNLTLDATRLCQVMELSEIYNITPKYKTEQELYEAILPNMKHIDFELYNVILVLCMYQDISLEFMSWFIDELKSHDCLYKENKTIDFISRCIDPISILSKYDILNNIILEYAISNIPNIPIELICKYNIDLLSIDTLLKIDISNIDKCSGHVHMSPKATSAFVNILLNYSEGINYTVTASFINNIPYRIYTDTNVYRYGMILGKVGVVDEFIYNNISTISLLSYFRYMKNMNPKYFKLLMAGGHINESIMDVLTENDNLPLIKITQLSRLWNKHTKLIKEM